MTIAIWDSWTSFAFLEPVTLEYLVLALYGAVSVFLLIRSRQELMGVTHSWRAMALFLALLIAPLVTNRLLVACVSSSSLLPPPNVPLEPRRAVAPLLGVGPILAAAAWLGAGPAYLVGALSGVLMTGATTGGVAEPFSLAVFGYVAAFCLRQDYQGRLEALIRQPVVASMAGTPIASSLLLLSIWARVTDAGLAGLDYALQAAKVSAACVLLQAVFGGAAVQVLYVVSPSLRPIKVADRVSPFRRSLSRKLLLVVVPLIVATTLILVYAVTTVTLRGAREQAVRDLARDARSAADEIPSFIHTGQGLLAEFVRDERLVEGDQDRLQRLLESHLRLGAFFDRLILVGADGQIRATYPPPSTGRYQLTPQEDVLLERVLKDVAPQVTPGHRSQQDEALVSFLMPIESEAEEGASLGALIGRAHLQANPAISRLLADLQRTSGHGEGFVVDASGRVVAHPDPGAMLTTWEQERYHNCVPDTEPRGLVCEGRDPVQNTRELLYILPAEGYPWSVVIRLPYEVVLEQARQVAVPLLALQTIFGAGLVTAVVLLVGRMTHSLERLADAAERIAAGTLTEPIRVDGADEVGRLGTTFEDMRARLKDRMSDLSLLLEVSQAVSSTLDLSAGMSFVLEGALEATNAEVARAVFVTDSKVPSAVVARGKPGSDLEKVDRVLVAMLRDAQGPLVVQDLTRATGITDAAVVDGPIKAAVALPVRTRERLLAVIWLGYGTTQRFDKSKLDFLSMLTSQVAVLIENARLFQAVESERSRLAAILESTSDAVLVTDRQDRLLLVNPAAERALGVRSRTVLGCRIEQTELEPEVADAMMRSSTTGEAPREVLLPDGRVMYANVSKIVDSDGQNAGRVAVMRDITHFKELDEMKSEFLATVSHDLRAPLTFMRGYAHRLDAVGELNDTQQSYVQNILHGVQRIDDLVADLLDLSRIEAGLGVERAPCDLGLVLAEAVSRVRSQAAAKDVSLRTEPLIDSAAKGKGAVVCGDRGLLRQAIVNLLDNAIKYTPEGGSIAAELSLQTSNGRNRAVIAVSDTGIGIAPYEQARLFEKFYRTKRGDRAGASGTGLGLAIVKSIVERHKGKVWVDSKLDEGSTFYISLPLQEREPVLANPTAVKVN
ncbi:MAG: ATP-binding protein [Chloroflexota bacterium]|nr:ATP-binding protein [Chloroflexota bacterium]